MKHVQFGRRGVPDEMKAVTKQKCDAKVRTWLTATYTPIFAGTTPRQAILNEAERLRQRNGAAVD